MVTSVAAPAVLSRMARQWRCRFAGGTGTLACSSPCAPAKPQEIAQGGTARDQTCARLPCRLCSARCCWLRRKCAARGTGESARPRSADLPHRSLSRQAATAVMGAFGLENRARRQGIRRPNAFARRPHQGPLRARVDIRTYSVGEAKGARNQRARRGQSRAVILF